VEDPAGVSLEPGHDLGMLVRSVVVEDDMDHFTGRHLALDGVEKTDEFLVTVFLHAPADDGPVQDIEGGEQGGRIFAQGKGRLEQGLSAKSYSKLAKISGPTATRDLGAMERVGVMRRSASGAALRSTRSTFEAMTESNHLLAKQK
jgi:hypothetical protein